MALPYPFTVIQNHKRVAVTWTACLGIIDSPRPSSKQAGDDQDYGYHGNDSSTDHRCNTLKDGSPIDALALLDLRYDTHRFKNLVRGQLLGLG